MRHARCLLTVALGSLGRSLIDSDSDEDDGRPGAIDVEALEEVLLGSHDLRLATTRNRVKVESSV